MKMLIQYIVNGQLITEEITVKDLLRRINARDAFTAARQWIAANVIGARMKSIGMCRLAD